MRILINANVSFDVSPHNIAVKPKKSEWDQFDHPFLVAFLKEATISIPEGTFVKHLITALAFYVKLYSGTSGFIL